MSTSSIVPELAYEDKVVAGIVPLEEARSQKQALNFSYICKTVNGAKWAFEHGFLSLEDIAVHATKGMHPEVLEWCTAERLKIIEWCTAEQRRRKILEWCRKIQCPWYE